MPKRIAPHSLSIVLLCAAVPAFCQANYRANLTATSDYIATQQLADGYYSFVAARISLKLCFSP